jgi:hypothetical protein
MSFRRRPPSPQATHREPAAIRQADQAARSAATSSHLRRRSPQEPSPGRHATAAVHAAVHSLTMWFRLHRLSEVPAPHPEARLREEVRIQLWADQTSSLHRPRSRVQGQPTALQPAQETWLALAMARSSPATSFHHHHRWARVLASPAPAEKDSASGARATLAQFSLLPKAKVEATLVLESCSPPNPARKSDSPAPAVKAR